MKINTWHTPALAPTFGMPAFGPASRAALVAPYATQAAIAVSDTAVVCVGARAKGANRGTSAWSPPLS